MVNTSCAFVFNVRGVEDTSVTIWLDSTIVAGAVVTVVFESFDCDLIGGKLYHI